MKVEMETGSIPGIVSMVTTEGLSMGAIQQLSGANSDICYEFCDSSGCDCFDSGDCFDICGRAPDFKPTLGKNKIDK